MLSLPAASPLKVGFAMTAPTRYAAAAFFNSTTLMLASGRYAWSTDDRSVLVSSDETGVFNVYRLHVETGDKTALTQSETDSCYAVSTFPEDERVLYTADRGGNEINHVYVHEADGETRDLTPEAHAKSMFAGWSNDKKHFYVASNARDPQAFDVYQYRADDYARELIFRNDDLYGVTHLDGERHLALIKLHSNTNSDIYLHDMRGNQAAPRLVTPHDGPIEHNVYAFTRDGRHLVYGTNEHGEFRQAWQLAIETGERTPFVRDDWDVTTVQFSLSGRYRVVAVNDDARTRVEVFDQDSNRTIDLAALPAGDVTAMRFSRDESRLAVLLSPDTSPADVYVVELEDGRIRRLTQSLNPAIDEADLVTSEVARYLSYDGLEIPGILFRPQGAGADRPCPALVLVHGGPGGQSRCGYAPIIQHLVNHGYAVFAANNRGSSGYGKTFFHMADRRHGEADLDDIVWAQKYLASLDWVDSERIGIIGGSYGGYMVGAALAFRPEAFKVGIDIFGVMNWVRTLKSIPPWWGVQRDSLYDLMGDPATDEERLTRISPLFHAANIRTPLLVVQGANDPRVLQTESDEIVEVVRANGVPVEYVLFDDEGHGFSKRKNRIAASDTFVTFLERHL
jgi:dipeptidyl aminopeptidase/acylaminoacyl peptidase